MTPASQLRRTRALRVALSAFVLAAAACGPFARGANQRATVIFTNETLDQADVYATIAGTNSVRLGTVFASSTDTLYVPASVTQQGGQTSVVARLLARSTQPSTGPITIRSSDVIRVRLSADGRALFVVP